MEATPDDYLLPESTEDFRTRAKVEGFWMEAVKIMNCVKKAYYAEVRNGGDKPNFQHRIEAMRLAYEAVHEVYPPPPDSRPQKIIDAVKGTRDRIRDRERMVKGKRRLSAAALTRFKDIGETNNDIEEIQWVHHHMREKYSDPFECPSFGCWGLLEQAKKNPTWFYEKIYKPIVGDAAKKKAGVGESDEEKGERFAVDTLKAILAEAVAASQKVPA